MDDPSGLKTCQERSWKRETQSGRNFRMKPQRTTAKLSERQTLHMNTIDTLNRRCAVKRT